MKKQINFNDRKKDLTENDIDNLISLIGYRCRLKTLQRLRSVLKYHAVSMRSYGIYDRLMFNEYGKNEWSYCAGQDYNSEIKLVRELMLKVV